MKEFDYVGISFAIIQRTSEAKYKVVKAFEVAKDKNDWAEADKLLKEAEMELNKASEEHLELISAEAGGQKLEISLFLMHAEDQYLTTQTFLHTVKMMVDMIKDYKNGK